MENTKTKESSTKQPAFSIYRPVEQSEGEKKLWPRVGVAFQNRDGSLNLILNEQIPANTRLQARAFRKGGRA